MTLLESPPAGAGRIAILPGSFNPPTRAHVEMARSALDFVDAVLFVLPQAFPHKDWSGASFDERIEMLRRVTAAEPRFAIGVSDGGLYIEMAREARVAIPGAEVQIICGGDAAERIANWDYGEPGVFERMLNEFHLLVAPRSGEYSYPTSERVQQLPLAEECQAMSASEVRERIRSGKRWEHLVPEEIREMVTRIYS